MDFNVIPIVSDINNKAALLFEHGIINQDTQFLTHAMVKINGKYHWLVSEEIGTQLKFYTDDNKIVCPCCKDELRISAAESTKMKTHLRHRRSDIECEFKTKYNSNVRNKEKKDGGKGGESEAHLEMKEQLALLIETSKHFGHEVKLRKAKSYEVKVDSEHRAYIRYQYETVKLVKAEIEKQVVRKEGDLKGFRSDLNVYDEDGNIYFIEVTYTSGKPLNSYYELWKRGNSTVYEVKATKSKVSLKDSFQNNYLISNESGELEGIEMRLLYDPIIDEGQRELMRKKAAKAIDRKSYLAGELRDELKKARRKNRVYKKQNKTTDKWHHHRMGTDEFVTSYLYIIRYKGEIFKEKMPKEVAVSLMKTGIYVVLYDKETIEAEYELVNNRNAHIEVYNILNR